jgi:hypothetical protein
MGKWNNFNPIIGRVNKKKFLNMVPHFKDLSQLTSP